MDLEETRGHLHEEIDRIFDEEIDGVLISRNDLAVVQDLLVRLLESSDAGVGVLLEEWQDSNPELVSAYRERWPSSEEGGS
jgi:hypothetical protein